MSFLQPPNGGGTGTFADQRAAPRFALLLRAAKLISDDGGEYLCIMRDVSSTGVKLRLFHSLGDIHGFLLETMTGERIALDLIWEHGREAGFRFHHPIDIKAFVAESGSYAKRPIRIAVEHPARISFSDQSINAKLLNLSRQGANLEVDHHLALGQNLRIEADGLPMFEATVCWRREPCYGLVFHQIMSLEELAVRTFRIRARPFRRAGTASPLPSCSNACP